MKKRIIYGSVGRGGYSLHDSRGTNITGYPGLHEPIAYVRNRYGNEFPIINTLVIPDDRIVETTSIPLVAVTRNPEQKFTSMSYEELDYVIDRYKALGATIH